MFELELAFPTKKVTWTYDIKSGSLYDEDGELAVFAPSVTRDKINGISKQNPGKKSPKVDVLKIQLGLKCNFSCTYCLQANHISEAKNTRVEDANDFLAGLDSWLEGSPSRIEFWGGEPLLYYNKLKILVPELRERFPDASMLMITNGSLLCDPVVDFIKKYDINVAVSHDAFGQDVRGEDPFKNPIVLRAVQRLVDEREGSFSVNTVIHSKNNDIKKVVKYFKDIFGEYVNVSFEGVVSYFDESFQKEMRMTTPELESMAEQLAENLLDQTIRNSSYGHKLNQFLKDIAMPSNVESRYSKCGMDKEDKITVDLQGNVTTCQNTGPSGKHYAGNVKELKAVRVRSSTHFSERSNCNSCEMLRVCGGSCMYLEGNDFAESCRADYYQALGVFKAGIKIASGGGTLVSIRRANSIPLTLVED